MHVALVIERFEPHGGGVEGAAWNTARALGAAGERVHVIARRAAPEPLPGVAVETCAVPGAWQPLRVLAFSAAAERAARRGGFDVVQSFSRTRHQDVYRAGGGCHAAYLERAHGARGARWRRATPRHALLLALEAGVFADPRQWILCNSEMVRRELAERHRVPEARLVVIPNGVDLEHFHPTRQAAAGAALRRTLDPDAERVWLLVGSGFRRKGVDTALAALARSDDPGARLWVVGRDAPAPWRARAAALGVAERVRFLGARDDLPRLYAACDALLLPTRYDAFANVCLEAAASGRPVVTSAANGAAEWLGDAALCVADPEDADAFAGALSRLGDAALRERLGAAARARAERASWREHAAQLRRLYARGRP